MSQISDLFKPKGKYDINKKAKEDPVLLVCTNEESELFPNPNRDLRSCVFIVGSSSFGFTSMFAKLGCTKAESIMDSDLVVFTGGADVHPSFYGQEMGGKTWCTIDRDKKEKEIYETCVKFGIPMLGICRGAQFLHVMNGGELYQDVKGHLGNHLIRTHNNHTFETTSTHHQMVKFNDRMKVLAEAHGVATERTFGPIKSKIGHTETVVDHKERITQEIEAFIYKDTLSLGIQGHPEYSGCPDFTAWVMTQIEDELYGLCKLPKQGEARSLLFTKI